MSDSPGSPDPAKESPAGAVVGRLRAAYRMGRMASVPARRQQLAALRAMLTERTTELLAAVRTDLGKPEPETQLTEIDYVVDEIDLFSRNLDDWLRPQPVPVPSIESLAGSVAWTAQEPLGVTLIIGPWNFPVHATLLPLVGALAAGNCAVLKPSELAPAVSEALGTHLPRYLDPDVCDVVQGGVRETAELLDERFDHIFFTGSQDVGRKVMRAAARHLTPVTLEMGGKSPVFVDADTDVAVVAERLVATKYLCAGQMCHGPDFVITDSKTARALEPALVEAINSKFGDDPIASPAYARIINDRHFDRLTKLLDSGRTVVGGRHDRAVRYIAPTVLADVSSSSPVMQQEIFGPILPIVTVPGGVDEAIRFVNDREKPLALYVFSHSATTRKRFERETSSGMLAFGIPVMHIAVHDLPFGGVGASGMGAFHGRKSLETFSHHKSLFSMPMH